MGWIGQLAGGGGRTFATYAGEGRREEQSEGERAEHRVRLGKIAINLIFARRVRFTHFSRALTTRQVLHLPYILSDSPAHAVLRRTGPLLYCCFGGLVVSSRLVSSCLKVFFYSYCSTNTLHVIYIKFIMIINLTHLNLIYI